MTTTIAIYLRRKLFWLFIQGMPSHQFLSSLMVSNIYDDLKFILDTFEGGITEGFEFYMGEDTEVVRSCSAILNGELFVFGGNSKTRQVSLNCIPGSSNF